MLTEDRIKSLRALAAACRGRAIVAELDFRKADANRLHAKADAAEQEADFLTESKP